MTGRAIAHAAETLVGTPFRLHGRNPAYGLDCVGVAGAAFARAGLDAAAPTQYRLRNARIGDALAFAGRAGLAETDGPIAPGDVILAQPGPAQFHLLVAGSRHDLIHAHAGLRRVVATPLPVPWPIVRHWRLKVS